jgi:tRNA threonylcarbamoyl adenosine modification protein YeaZ
MATAKGIAFAAKKPLWAVSSLAALAWDARTSIRVDRVADHSNSVFVAVLDARRSEVFAGCYGEGHMKSGPEPEWRLLDEERVFAPSELAAWAKTIAGDRAIYFSGDAIDTYPELRSIGTWLDIKTPSGAAIAHLARTGERIDILTSGAPTYIRPSEAEVMYPDGVPGALRRP